MNGRKGFKMGTIVKIVIGNIVTHYVMVAAIKGKAKYDEHKAKNTEEQS